MYNEIVKNTDWDKIKMLQAYLMIIDDERDKDKFICIYEKYHKMIYSTAYKIIKSYHIAEEIEQDAFLKIVKNIGKIVDINSKETRNYIITLTKNTAINIYNKEKQPCETIDENMVNNTSIREVHYYKTPLNTDEYSV